MGDCGSSGALLVFSGCTVPASYRQHWVTFLFSLNSIMIPCWGCVEAVSGNSLNWKGGDSSDRIRELPLRFQRGGKVTHVFSVYGENVYIEFSPKASISGEELRPGPGMVLICDWCFMYGNDNSVVHLCHQPFDIIWNVNFQNKAKLFANFFCKLELNVKG